MDIIRKALQATSPITDEDWEKVQDVISKKKIAKGEQLLAEGDICDKVYFIESGLMRLYYLKDGQEYIRQFFFENGFLTDLASCLTLAPSRMNIDAVEPTQLYVLDYPALARAYDTSMNLQKMGRKIVEWNFMGLANRMTSLFLLSPEARYEELVANRPKVVERIPQYMIASYLGVTPEGLSRIRRRLARGGKRS